MEIDCNESSNNEPKVTIYEIFCDGSCNNRAQNKPGGWGVAVYENNECVAKFSGYSYHTTSNRMELTALINALLTSNIAEPCVIYSDSTYALHSAELHPNYIRQSMINFDLICVVVELRNWPNNSNTFLVHVKGHSNIVGNETAHSLAHEAYKQANLATQQ